MTAYRIEPSKPFYEHAIGSMGISPDRRQMTFIEKADYAESTFDFVTFGAVLEYLYDPSESICTALKWTKPGA